MPRDNSCNTSLLLTSRPSSGRLDVALPLVEHARNIDAEDNKGRAAFQVRGREDITISRSFCRTTAPNEKTYCSIIDSDLHEYASVVGKPILKHYKGAILTVEYHHTIMPSGFIISGVDSCGRISAVFQMIHFLAC